MKFKIGDKVVPISKTVIWTYFGYEQCVDNLKNWVNGGCSGARAYNQDGYMTVEKIENGIYCVNKNYFNEADLVLLNGSLGEI